MNEDDFRFSIEAMLREGLADSAAEKLRHLLEPYAGEGNILPPRFLTVSASDVAIAGWDDLAQRIGQYDRPNHRISALGIALTHPADAGVSPDAAGRLAPCIETNYLSDEAYPFSEADRNDLLDGYSVYGCAWNGDSAETDSTLSVEGIDDLYGAIVQLETRLLASDEPGDEEICAGSLGACYLAVLIYQAVNDNIRKHGLPRPLCVMAGCNGVYPFFDAPVISSEECVDGGLVIAARQGAAASSQEDGDEEEPAEAADSAQGYGSLLGSMGKVKKRPVIVLDDAEVAVAIRQIAASALAAADAAQAPVGPMEAPVEAEVYAGDTEYLEEAGYDEPVGREDVHPEIGVPAADVPAYMEPTAPEAPEFEGFAEDEAANDAEISPAEWSDWPAAEEAIAAALHESAYEPSAPEPKACAFEYVGYFAEAEMQLEVADRSITDEVVEPPAPVIVRTGHGLRGKLVQSRPSQPGFTGLIGKLLGWLRGWIGRR